jgi:GT2 family glycosyltransferase/SAM-dependent methyltransferase
MGEIFKRQAAAAALRFSGERLTDEAKGQIEIEHLHRYFIARHYCRGKDVLDIASGEGYGAAYLAQVAQSVVGVEIDPISVEHATKSYDYPNLRFQIGDARRINLPDASIDVVVSFETLEHFFEQEAFLKEVRRVLRCDGILIISTPDQDIYSPTSSSANPFHVRELTKDQFVSLLKQNFPWVSLCLQRPLIGSVVVPENSIQEESPALFFEKRGPEYFESNEGMARPLYLLAFASATTQPIPKFSAYIEDNAIDFWRVRASELQVELSELRAETRTLYQSRSWRLLAPLRHLVASLRRLRRPEAHINADIPSASSSKESDTLKVAHEPSANEVLSSQAMDETLVATQKKYLGDDYLHKKAKVAIGVVSYNNAPRDLKRLFSSAQVAAVQANIDDVSIYLLDNGAATDRELISNFGLLALETQGNIGFGAAHNHLMQRAFTDGAEFYIAANPDGAFHPDALKFIIAMNAAQDGSSLIEALQFPEEHPKIFDISNFDTPWASGACLTIPRKIYETLGGFDESFFMYCEDVDYSWRARANGFSVKICPRALFFHATTNREPSNNIRIMMLRSGITLAQKWGGQNFERDLVAELKKMKFEQNSSRPDQVESSWQEIADFEHFFHFAKVRWS